MVPEDRKLQGLLLGFPVEQNISLAVLVRLTERGFIDSKEESAVSDRQIKALNIKTPSGKTKIRTLSGGNQQKAILGRWLEMNPGSSSWTSRPRGSTSGASTRSTC